MQPQAEQLVNKAAALAEQGSFEAAVPFFQQAIELDPAQGTAHDMLAQCCMEAGRHAEALSAARTACQLLPADPHALSTLGRAARNAGGQLKEAATAFAAALEALAVLRSSCSSSLEELDSDFEAELQQELREVEELRLLELGHAIGLPGLRIQEARAGSALGPGGVVWESGMALARLLVACCKGEQPTARHTCSWACGAGCGAKAAGMQAAGSPALGLAAPLPGMPTFALSPGEPAAVAVPPPAPPPAARAAVGGVMPNLYATGQPGGPAASSNGSTGPGSQPPTTRSSSSSSLFAGCQVLELGSGTGVVGITAACLGAYVQATDLPSVLPLLRGNIELNRALIEAAGGHLAAEALDWEEASIRGVSRGSGTMGPSIRATEASLGPAAAPQPGLDWVLGADLVYSLAPVGPLVATLASLVHGAAAEVPPAGDGGSQADGQASNAQQEQQQGRGGGVKLLIAHKCRHQEVDSALLEGLRRTGVPVRAVARDMTRRVIIYGNAAAATALGL